jgi:hypothetical protein
MKSLLLVIPTALLFTILSSCVPAANMGVELPHGVWRSIEHNIVLYIKPEYQSPAVARTHYLGIHTTDYGEQVKIFGSLDNRSMHLSLQRVDSWDLERGGIAAWGTIVEGRYEFVDDEIRIAAYTLNLPGRIHAPRPNVIVFTRWEDYEPINPAEWFVLPTIPPGVWRSVEPNIVIYAKPEYQHSLHLMPEAYLGIYTTDYEEIKMLAGFDAHAVGFSFRRPDNWDAEGNMDIFTRALYWGRFKPIDNELHFFVGPDIIGQPIIVFHRWEDYEPINPDDWFRQGRHESTESELPPDMQ